MEEITFTIRTACAHCGQEIRIEMDQDLKYSIPGQSANPLIFVPMVDFDRLEDPSIIDAF
jgi:hypothetical protein